ncbi:16251_t:CDS:2 [Funneliformis geosporum]|nr:16251_t:CDS:2 [Funneliformis geosporum]
MNVTKEIQRINSREIERNISVSGSWHAQYRDSPYIFVGNIPFDLTEGDIITIFSQYGEILDIQLVRNRETGESKGFGFLRYEDQRSTILAVDNLNNYTLLGRTLRVDHASAETKDGEKRTGMNAAPPLMQKDGGSESDTEDSEDLERKVDPDDPMREFIIKKLKKERKKAKKKSKEEKKKRKRNEDDE